MNKFLVALGALATSATTMFAGEIDFTQAKADIASSGEAVIGIAVAVVTVVVVYNFIRNRG